MAKFDPQDQLHEVFRWNPKWWWDPIPPWFIDELQIDVRRDLLRTQLEKQHRILEAELESIQATMKLLDRG